MNKEIRASGGLFLATAGPVNPAGLATNFAELKISAIVAAEGLLQSFRSDDEAGFAAAIDYISSHCLSADQVAEICQVSLGTVSRWASGNAKPIKIARVYAIEQIRTYLCDIVDQARNAGPRAVVTGRRVAKIIPISSRKSTKTAKTTKAHSGRKKSTRAVG
ncbi:MAG: hypothetical protein AB7I36_08620 [Rhodospirillaceae bacterium]